ncbi:MAG: ribosome maturation factor RimP [Alphaproteobacteria bacterium]
MWNGITVNLDPARRIDSLIEPSLVDMGYELVRVRLSGSENRILQIMAERADGGDMTVEDCASISRAVSAILDVEDPIRGAYSLEVSSPGIDRPLTREKDFDRYVGHVARIELRQLIDGRKRYNGRLLGVEANMVQLATDHGDVELPFKEIAAAKLVLTDELIAESEDGAKH